MAEPEEETDSRGNHEVLRQRIRHVCTDFQDRYWRALDEKHAYPNEFVAAMTKAGLMGALIPEEYGGLGFSLTETSVILEEVNRMGGNAGTVHAQMYTMGTILRHGSEAQKRQYLPDIARGQLRLQAFGVTEPEAGTDTLSIATTARLEGDRYVINGRKVYISRVRHSDLMILLARTTPREQAQRRSDGLSLFIIELANAVGHGLEVTPIRVMFNNETSALNFTNVEVPAENLIGEVDKGFHYVLDGLNAERILIAGECIGDGRWFVKKATDRAKQRVVFNRPIGQNQGIQFPLAQSYAHVEAADLMRFRAAELFDAGRPCGPEANMAKLLAADASWEAANAAVQTYGGDAFAADYDIERKFRETRLYQVAPISTNMILSYIAEHVLGLPRSY